jgi:hypothetical protein
MCQQAFEGDHISEHVNIDVIKLTPEWMENNMVGGWGPITLTMSLTKCKLNR